MYNDESSYVAHAQLSVTWTKREENILSTVILPLSYDCLASRRGDVMLSPECYVWHNLLLDALMKNGREKKPFKYFLQTSYIIRDFSDIMATNESKWHQTITPGKEGGKRGTRGSFFFSYILSIYCKLLHTRPANGRWFVYDVCHYFHTGY